METTSQTEKASAARIAHTPGPWENNGDGTITTSEHSVAIVNEHLRASTANAALIAAAPDLLEACKMAESMLSRTSGQLTEKLATKLFCQLQGVIAKAKGRQP